MSKWETLTLCAFVAMVAVVISAVALSGHLK